MDIGVKPPPVERLGTKSVLVGANRKFVPRDIGSDINVNALPKNLCFSGRGFLSLFDFDGSLYTRGSLATEKYYIVYSDETEECIGGTLLGFIKFINPFAKKSVKPPFINLPKQIAVLKKYK